MSDLRGELVGCGYFADNHLNAWREVCRAVRYGRGAGMEVHWEIFD